MRYIPLAILILSVFVSCKTISPFKVRPNVSEEPEPSVVTEEPTKEIYKDTIVEIAPQLDAIMEARGLFIEPDEVIIPEVVEEKADDPVEGLIPEEPTEEPLFDVVLINENEPQEAIVEPLAAEVEEVAQVIEVEQAEAILERSDEDIHTVDTMGNTMVVPPTEQKTVLQTIEETIRGDGEPKEAVVAGNVLPMWFVYTFAFLFLACLFTLCYISKNRRWRRVHGD